MLITVKQLQEFWSNIPEGKQLASILIVAVGILLGVCAYLYKQNENDRKAFSKVYLALQEKVTTCENEKLEIERQHAKKDSVTAAVYIKKLEDKAIEMEAKNEKLDELLQRQNQIPRLQSRVNRNLKSIQKEASK